MNENDLVESARPREPRSLSLRQAFAIFRQRLRGWHEKGPLFFYSSTDFRPDNIGNGLARVARRTSTGGDGDGYHSARSRLDLRRRRTLRTGRPRATSRLLARARPRHRRTGGGGAGSLATAAALAAPVDNPRRRARPPPPVLLLLLPPPPTWFVVPL